MTAASVHPFRKEYASYLRDESRQSGSAESIVFPHNAEEIVDFLKNYRPAALTIQGARTGIAAGAVPQGGSVITCEKMRHITGLREQDGAFFLTVQAGVLLTEIRQTLSKKAFDIQSWSEESKNALKKLNNAPPLFFPPDPTEVSAAIGGMVSSNASGACSLYYGPTRQYIQSLRIVLADGETLCLQRGNQKVSGGHFRIQTESGKTIEGTIPSVAMPPVKSAAGYFLKQDMDLIDLFIGMEGTLGIISEIELLLLPKPPCIWGLVVFLPSPKETVSFVNVVRSHARSTWASGSENKVTAIEYFDTQALRILRNQKEQNPAFSDIPPIPPSAGEAIYVEFQGTAEEHLEAMVMGTAEILVNHGGDEDATWIADNETEMGKLKFFRHAVPESINLLIDERRKVEPEITKLGTDMAVPDNKLSDVLQMYTSDLEQAGLDYAIFGHIGNNHVHVNILPNNAEQYAKGKELYLTWAQKIVSWGGTVSAEHGIGKIKVPFLEIMYGKKVIDQMKAVKKIFDPRGVLNPGNLFIL